jgi:AcrR family transcriptional regulator
VPRWRNHLRTNESLQRLKREAVLKEARRAFGKSGYHNTSLDEIASALHVSKGTLYNYVKDKQELLYECHSLALDIGERAVEHSEKESLTGAEMLRHALMHNIVSLTEEFGAFAVLTEVDALRPKDRIEIVKRRDGIEKRMVSLINSGIKDGSLRPLDPKIVVKTYMGVINWIPRWYSADGRLTGHDIAQQITDLLMAGSLNPARVPQAGAAEAASSGTPPGRRLGTKASSANKRRSVN